MNEVSARLIAFYLPQFHPIPENDEWWGKGFTEWTNVTKAKPMYPGHRQPNLPADLGFYDLRLPESRQAQADLARAYGIEGFCYWHYWFGNGRRLLERVFDEVLASGKPDFPFCLAWANESWNRSWVGQAKQTLIEQTYPGEQDYREHFQFLLRAFRDPRYIRVDGKPLFVIYEPTQLPNAREVIAFWKKLAVEAGLPGLFIPGIGEEDLSLEAHGLDARIPPQPWSFMRLKSESRQTTPPSRAGRWLNKIWSGIKFRLKIPNIHFYRPRAKLFASLPPCKREMIPCVMPNWDYTPRSRKLDRCVIFPDASPELYRTVLRKAVADVAGRPPDHRLVFLKSWNEWAEGNHLEPDQHFGHAFLQVTKEEVQLPENQAGQKHLIEKS